MDGWAGKGGNYAWTFESILVKGGKILQYICIPAVIRHERKKINSKNLPTILNKSSDDDDDDDDQRRKIILLFHVG